MRKRLPRDGHSAFKAVGERREALVTPPQIQSVSEVGVPEESDHNEPFPEENEDLSL